GRLYKDALFKTPEAAKRRLVIYRDHKMPAVRDMVGRFRDRVPHMAGMVKNAPAINDIEFTETVFQDVRFENAVIIVGMALFGPFPDNGARGFHGQRIDIDRRHGTGARNQRGEGMNAGTAADIKKALVPDADQLIQPLNCKADFF